MGLKSWKIITIRILGDKDKKGGIQLLKKRFGTKKISHNIHNIKANNLPKVLEKEHRETIKAKNFITFKIEDCNSNLFTWGNFGYLLIHVLGDGAAKLP